MAVGAMVGAGIQYVEDLITQFGDYARPSDEQYVIRGGYATTDNLIGGTGPVRGYAPLTGFSTTSAPGMSPSELAMVAKYKNGMISYTTVGQIRSLGYDVVPTPLPGQPLHHTVITPYPLPTNQGEILSNAFSSKFVNPAKAQ